MKDGGDIYGTGVNVAVRLEGLADPGGILISEHAYQQVHDKLEIDLRDRGPQTLKNIDEPVRAYAIYIDTAQSAPSDAPKPKSPPRWRAAAAAIVIAGLVGALAWQSSRPPTVETAVVADMAYPLPDKPSIAVLPFEDLSFEQNGEALAEGMSEDILTALSKLSQLFVISGNTTSTYKGQDVTVKQVAEDLSVQFVLEGSVQRDGDTMRVTAQLIDALSGQHVWADRYDRATTDLFDVKDEITLNVVSNIGAELLSGQRDLITSRETDNLEAWLLLHEGYDLMQRFTPEDNSLARELFSKAASIDPEFAAAYAAIGGTYRIEGQVGWTPTPSKSYEEAMNFFNLALEIDPKSSKMELAVLYQALGNIDLAVETAAEEARLRPNDTIVRSVLRTSFGGLPNAIGQASQFAFQRGLGPRQPGFGDGWARR